MTMLKRGLDAMMGKASDRLPLSPTAASVNNSTIVSTDFMNASSVSNLGLMADVGWLFSVVTRITESLSAVEWKVTTTSGDDLPLTHPALTLWNQPNEFLTGSDFREASQQHVDLTGSSYWLIVRSSRGAVEELWPLRPDRVRPIPGTDEFIRGWVYKLGSAEFTLEAGEIVWLRMPNPLDPYKGLGPVQALLTDILSERESSKWGLKFFQNDASPGGIIEFDQALQDADFDRMVARWNRQHKGVSNAHRVAIIERGKWVDRKLTQRDMQFEALRHLTRDNILGGFGVPKSVMGISEDVNRANAEAGETTFSRHVLLPRLRRIRAALNQHIAPLFGANIVYQFEDPTPQDREVALQESTQGRQAGVMTLNESRMHIGLPAIEDGRGEAVAGLAFPSSEVQESSRLFEAGILTLNEAREANDLSPVPEGDTFVSSPAQPGGGNPGDIVGDLAQLAALWEERQALPLGRDIPDPANMIPQDVEDAEIAMEDAWAIRLDAELRGLVRHIEAANKSTSLSVAGTSFLMKIGPDDAAGYDWDWSAKYLDDVVAELMSAFTIAAELEGIEGGLTARLAADYALERGSALLSVDGAASIVRTTRDGVNELVAQAVDNGQSLNELTKALEENNAFSKSRARMIARTETAEALGEGSEQAALSQGRDEKHWRTQGVDVDGGDVNGPCRRNERQGWIAVGETFDSGVRRVPAHPNCRCVVSYRTAAVQEPAAAIYCPGNRCGRRLPIGRIVAELEVFCRGCNTLWAETDGHLMAEAKAP